MDLFQLNIKIALREDRRKKKRENEIGLEIQKKKKECSITI